MIAPGGAFIVALGGTALEVLFERVAGIDIGTATPTACVGCSGRPGLDGTAISGRWGTMAVMGERVALVTGAASGIGRATSIGLVPQGAVVVLLVRNSGRGEQAMREIRAIVPDANLEALACDLSSQASIREAAGHLPDRSRPPRHPGEPSPAYS